VQRELSNAMAVSVGYVGARGDHLALGGSADPGVPININQLDPKYLALGAALDQPLPNPFFGNPDVPASLATLQTLPRSRLLRPFPQYNQVNAYQVTEGYSRYHAAVFEWNRRVVRGWGGRASYTYSVLKDNQFGEDNFYSPVSPGLPVNNYNFIRSAPACQAGQQFTTACYDPSSEYSRGLLDVPHRVILTPIVELPFGQGKRWADSGGVSNLLVGGWVVAATITLQSGFPINVQQTADSRLGGSNANRPNLTGQPLETPGGYEDRLASADHPGATWINPAAFRLAPAGTFGNVPRTLTDIRSPAQYNTDAVFIKNFRLRNTHTAQVKLELLNLFNRVNVRGLRNANNFSNANFGQIATQGGFMRITQIMFRYSF
jgi:hypothetical protein